MTMQCYPQVRPLFEHDTPMAGRKNLRDMTVEELATELVNLKYENEHLDILIRRRVQVLTCGVTRSDFCYGAFTVVVGLVVLGVIMWRVSHTATATLVARVVVG